MGCGDGLGWGGVGMGSEVGMGGGVMCAGGRVRAEWALWSGGMGWVWGCGGWCFRGCGP